MNTQITNDLILKKIALGIVSRIGRREIVALPEQSPISTPEGFVRKDVEFPKIGLASGNFFDVVESVCEPTAQKLADHVAAVGWWCFADFKCATDGRNCTSHELGVSVFLTETLHSWVFSVIGRGSPSPYGAYTRQVGVA